MGSFSSGFEKSGRVPNEPGPNPAAWILGVVPGTRRVGCRLIGDGVVACCGSGFRIMGGKTAGRSRGTEGSPPRGGMPVGSRVIPTAGSRVIPVGAGWLSGRSLGMRWKILPSFAEVESSFSKGPDPAGVAMVGGRIVGLTEGVENLGLVGLKAGLVTVFVGEKGFLAVDTDLVEVGSMLIKVPAGSVNREVVACEGREIFEGLKGRRVVVTSIVVDSESNSLVLNGKLSVLIRIGLVGRMMGRLENVPSITEISSSMTLVGSIRSMPAGAVGKVGRVAGLLEGVGRLKSLT